MSRTKVLAIPEETHAKIKAMAEEDGVTMAALTATLLARGMDATEQELNPLLTLNPDTGQFERLPDPDADYPEAIRADTHPALKPGPPGLVNGSDGLSEYELLLELERYHRSLGRTRDIHWIGQALDIVRAQNQTYIEALRDG